MRNKGVAAAALLGATIKSTSRIDEPVRLGLAVLANGMRVKRQSPAASSHWRLRRLQRHLISPPSGWHFVGSSNYAVMTTPLERLRSPRAPLLSSDQKPTHTTVRRSLRR